MPSMRSSVASSRPLSRPRLRMKGLLITDFLLWVSSCPSASLTALPIMMPRVMWAKSIARAITRQRPMKLPYWTKALGGRSGKCARSHLSLLPPELITRCSPKTDRETPISRRIESTHASVEKGRSTPVVPRIEMPSTTPSRGLKVCGASVSPSGTVMVMSMPTRLRSTSRPTASVII